jgi:hypothetical protein
MQGWYAPILLNSTGVYYLAPTTWTESLAHVTGNPGVVPSIRVGKSE